MEILISLQRIFFMKNINFSLKNSTINWLLIALFLFTLFIYSPSLAFFQINSSFSKVNNFLIYKREPSEYFKQSHAIKIALGATQGLRLVLILILLVTLNFLTCYFFQKRATKKKRLISNINYQQYKNSESYNVSKMVIFICLNYTIGNLLNPFLYYFKYFFEFHDQVITILSLISNSLLFGSLGLNFFIYYTFNLNFRNVFRQRFSFLTN